MPKDSPGFLFLQQIRDESHRFAITSNRKKKNKSVKKSSLDSIKGSWTQEKERSNEITLSLFNRLRQLQ
jgi:excinuclease ABC subunit C